MNNIAAALLCSFLLLGLPAQCLAGSQPTAVLQIGHAGQMTSAAWSPDGKFLVTGGEDDHVLIWRADKSELLARLEPSPDPRGVSRNGGIGLGIQIDQIIFSPDGSVLLGTRKMEGRPDTVAWDFRARKELTHIPGLPIKILDDNDSVFVLDDKQVFLWSIREGKRIRAFGDTSILTDEAKLSSDNNYVLSYRGANWVVSDKTARLWEASSGKLLQTWKHDAGIVGVDFDEGEHAALALSTSGILAVIKTPTLKIHEVKLDTKGRPNSIHWAWPGVVAVEIQSKSNSSAEIVSFFDTTSGKMLRSVEGEWIGRATDGSQVINQGKRWFVSELHQTVVLPSNLGPLRTLGQQIFKPWVPSPDGRAFIANRYIDKANGRYAASSVATSLVPQISVFKDGALLHQLPNGNLVAFQSMTSTSDGRLLVLSRGRKSPDSNMGDGGALVVWDLEQGGVLKNLEGVKASGRIQMLPETQNLLVESSSEDNSSVLDSRTGILIRSYPFTNMRFTASGTWAAIKDNQIILGKADSTTPSLTLQELPHQNDRTLFSREQEVPRARITHVAISPDRKIIAASLALFGSGGAHWGGLALWDAESGQFLRSIDEVLGEVNQFSFTPNGRNIITAESYTMTARMWDVETAKKVREFPHSDSLSSLAVSPDGRTLLTSSSGYRGDMAAYLWDISTGRRLAKLAGHSAPVSSVGFLKGGRIAVTASKDGGLRFWDTVHARLLVTVLHEENGAWVALTPEGRFDTNQAVDQIPIRWVMPDDPDNLLSVERFKKDYYEPRLLPRILNGEKFKPIRAQDP
jgi:WD40 repeat protein